MKPREMQLLVQGHTAGHWEVPGDLWGRSWFSAALARTTDDMGTLASTTQEIPVALTRPVGQPLALGLRWSCHLFLWLGAEFGLGLRGEALSVLGE